MAKLKEKLLLPIVLMVLGMIGTKMSFVAAVTCTNDPYVSAGLASIIGFVIIPCLFVWGASGRNLKELSHAMHCKMPAWPSWLALPFLAFGTYSALHLFVSIGYINAFAPELNIGGLPPWWQSILAICVIPALTEEIFFRGLLLRYLRKYSTPIVAILIQGYVFGIMHHPQMMGAAMIGGMIFGWIAIRTRSIIPCMILHFFINAASVNEAYHFIDVLWMKNTAHVFPMVALVLNALCGIGAGMGILYMLPCERACPAWMSRCTMGTLRCTWKTMTAPVNIGRKLFFNRKEKAKTKK